MTVCWGETKWRQSSWAKFFAFAKEKFKLPFSQSSKIHIYHDILLILSPYTAHTARYIFKVIAFEFGLKFVLFVLVSIFCSFFPSSAMNRAEQVTHNSPISSILCKFLHDSQWAQQVSCIKRRNKMVLITNALQFMRNREAIRINFSNSQFRNKHLFQRANVEGSCAS